MHGECHCQFAANPLKSNLLCLGPKVVNRRTVFVFGIRLGDIEQGRRNWDVVSSSLGRTRWESMSEYVRDAASD
jgi:hypothetical protein